MDDVTPPFNPLLQNSSALHSVASGGRYKSLLRGRPWRSSSCKYAPLNKTPTVCNIGVMWLWLCSNWHRWPHTMQVYPKAHHTHCIYLSLTAWTKYLFFLCTVAKHLISNACLNLIPFFNALHFKAANILYTTAPQSILSFNNNYSISWCVMCYRLCIYSHSTLCATSPLSAWGHPHSTRLCAVNTPKKPLLWDSFPHCVRTKTLHHMIDIVELSHISAVFFCAFMPHVKKGTIGLSAGSTESTENQEFKKKCHKQKVSWSLDNLELLWNWHPFIWGRFSGFKLLLSELTGLQNHICVHFYVGILWTM